MSDKDPFEIANECVAFGVRRVSRLVTIHYDHHLAGAGLRSTQFTILNALKALEEVTVNELAGQLQTDRTTLTRNLQLLQHKGLIEKLSGRDKRIRNIRLTESGTAVLDNATDAWQTAQDVITSRMGDSHYRRLMADLSLMEEVLS
jgi:DNA-binding MarR family transcriptional regulator